MATPILQFGTSCFLQAHVDLFVSQALARGEALGAITVVQTTRSAESQARVAAFNAGGAYPVRVRGLVGGHAVDETVACRGVAGAWQAESAWPQVRAAVCAEVQVIVSNTGDRGYLLDAGDGPHALAENAPAPISFPAKLLVLLHARWQCQAAAPLSIFPCELVSRNGDTLRDIVAALAAQWALPATFIAWLRGHVRWANSLVDRIVSEALAPIGAVAEPYALWAIERQPGLVLPCDHEAIVLTDDLAPFERRKLFLLNLGHSFLAERWLQGSRPADETVLAAMSDAPLRAELEALWADEVLPVFDAQGQGAEARRYLVELRDRLANPFLAHRLSDIATDHAQKKLRRFAPVVALAEALGLDRTQTPQTRLRSVLGAARWPPIPQSASP